MQKWLVPVNVKNFDLIAHFQKNETTFIKRNRALSVGDEVYIYVASPFSAVMYKGIVEKTGIAPKDIDKQFNIPTFDNKTYVLVRKTKAFPAQALTADKLKAAGLSQVVNQQTIQGKLAEFINSVDQETE